VFGNQNVSNFITIRIKNSFETGILFFEMD
jgi:hypothetical protein